MIKKLFRIILSIVLATCAIALFMLCFTLIKPPINWALLIPTATTAIGLLFIAWEIASGATWRDVVDFMVDTFYWR